MVDSRGPLNILSTIAAVVILSSEFSLQAAREPQAKARTLTEPLTRRLLARTGGPDKKRPRRHGTVRAALNKGNNLCISPQELRQGALNIQRLARWACRFPCRLRIRPPGSRMLPFLCRPDVTAPDDLRG
jgi:hypothetical protein